MKNADAAFIARLRASSDPKCHKAADRLEAGADELSDVKRALEECRSQRSIAAYIVSKVKRLKGLNRRGR